MGALFGKIGNNLTKAGVTDANGDTNYYDNPAQAGVAMARAAAKTTEPSWATVDGKIDAPTWTQDEPGGPLTAEKSETVNSNLGPAPVTAQPRMTHPSFADASAGGTEPFAPGLTTKGKILSSLLLGAEGFSNGLAAESEALARNPHMNPGIGPALVAGFQTPTLLRQQRDEQTARGLALQKEQAQIAALPGQQAQDRALKQSEIDRNNAMTNRRDVFQADGSIFERQADGSLKTLYEKPEKPDLAATIDGRKQIINGMKAASVGTPDYDAAGNLTGRTMGSPYTLTAAQEQQYVLTGKIPESKTSNPNQSELLLRAAQGDKDALKALQLQSDMEIRTHRGYQDGAGADGLTAAQQRSLKADATWGNLNRRMAALNDQYAKTAQYDPDGAEAIGKQIDTLAQQAEARKAQVLQGGKLRLRGANAAPPLLSSHAPAAAATKARDLGPAPAGRPEGATGTLPDGTRVVVRGGRIVAQ